MDRCPFCKQFIIFDSHKCPPKWYCLNVGDYEEVPNADQILDEGYVVYAQTAEKAAIEFAERYQGNCAWYPSEMSVYVFEYYKPEQSPQQFTVYQETRPTYWVE